MQADYWKHLIKSKINWK